MNPIAEDADLSKTDAGGALDGLKVVLLLGHIILRHKKSKYLQQNQPVLLSDT